MSMQLRPYQQKAREATHAGFREWDRQLGVLPTGSGKTIVFASISNDFQPERVLILAHREELIDQAIDKIHKATGLFAQKEMAESAASLSAAVVVASVQTMRRRLAKWPADHFGMVVVDEAHHAISEEYQSVLSHFGPAKVLGVTATPDRGDRRNLGMYFQNVAFEVSLFELINAGYLSRIVVKSLPLKIDLSSVKSVAGDYSPDDLGRALIPYLGAAAQAIKEHAAERRVLVFLPLIATSKDFVFACRDVGLDARHIDGKSGDRKEILRAFACGEFQLLSNAMLLTEGFDNPGIDCIVNLRPTRSRPLYSQIIGRGTRVSPGKPNLLLLDFLWQHEKHNLIRPAHLVAPSEEIAAIITETLEVESSGEQRDLDLEELAAMASRQREEKLRRELEEKSKRNAKTCDAMEFCLSVHALAAVEWVDEVEWHARPPSEKQLALIAGAGISPDGIKSRGQASAVIDVIQTRRALKLSTPKQIRLCRKLGHAAPEQMMMADASEFIESRIGRRQRSYRSSEIAA